EVGYIRLRLERVGVRGFATCRETETPHPTPLPKGEGAERARPQIIAQHEYPSLQELALALCAVQVAGLTRTGTTLRIRTSPAAPGRAACAPRPPRRRIPSG